MTQVKSHSPSGVPVEGPAAFVWALVLGGMTLTGVLALDDASFAWWSQTITSLLTRPVVQIIFAVAVFLHVAEGGIAFVLAKGKATDRQTWGWFAQTVLLGYFSLGILRKKLAS
jgi:hypothetical protein